MGSSQPFIKSYAKIFNTRSTWNSGDVYKNIQTESESKSKCSIDKFRFVYFKSLVREPIFHENEMGLEILNG